VTRYLDIVKSDDIRGKLSSALSIVLSQRLAPRLCQKCREPRKIRDEERDFFHKIGTPAPQVLFRRHGCPECGTGVRGRVPIIELLVMTPSLRDVMVSGSTFSSHAFRNQFVAEGGRSMGQHALALAGTGLIEFEEAKRHVLWVPDAPQ